MGPELQYVKFKNKIAVCMEALGSCPEFLNQAPGPLQHTFLAAFALSRARDCPCKHDFLSLGSINANFDGRYSFSSLARCS